MKERAFAALPGKIGVLALCVQQVARDETAGKPMDPRDLMEDATRLRTLANILEGCSSRVRNRTLPRPR